MSILQLVLLFSSLFSSFSSSSSSASSTKHVKTGKTPLYLRNYGEYSFYLNVGTPPQTFLFNMDTGSSFSWFPCTHNYTCTHCNSTYVDTAHIPTFIPESSSSYKPLACESPKCNNSLLVVGRLDHCNNNTLCGYHVGYGSGSTDGQLVSETLTMGGGLFADNFIFGCSLSSDLMPEGGIMGFGRGPESLPSQLGLNSFSYCLVSYQNPNPTASSDLVLTTTTTNCDGANINYTPFLNSPNHSSLSAFWRRDVLGNFYYVWIKNISVGGVDVKVLDEYLVLDAKGNGGTIVDTGSTLTRMEKPVFDLVINEFRKQVGDKLLDTAIEFENLMDMEKCYNVSRKCKKKLPLLSFRFLGGAEMVVPMANYFAPDDSVLCMCVEGYEGIDQWPAIILGNYQMQDHYMKFDLENNRLGIRPQKCAY